MSYATDATLPGWGHRPSADFLASRIWNRLAAFAIEFSLIRMDAMVPSPEISFSAGVLKETKAARLAAAVAESCSTGLLALTLSTPRGPPFAKETQAAAKAGREIQKKIDKADAKSGGGKEERCK